MVVVGDGGGKKSESKEGEGGRRGRRVSEGCRGGGIMTGERELPGEGESARGGERIGARGPD